MVKPKGKNAKGRKRGKLNSYSRSMRNVWYRDKSYYINVRGATRSILPNRMATKLVFSETFDNTGGAGTAWAYIYSLNGMNDPNITGGSTHQPMGFDQLAQLYNNYIVTGCKVVLEGHPYAAGTFHVSMGGINAGSSPPITEDHINEDRRFISVISNNQQNFKLKKFYDNAKVLGITKNTLTTNSNYWGLSTGTTNPSFGDYLALRIYNMDVSEQNIFQMTVTLVYYVTYFNPKDLGQS